MLVKYLTVILFASLAMAQQSATPDTTRPEEVEKKLASLEGKLIDASTGQPVRKANVVLMQVRSGGGGMMAGPPSSTAASSDSEGKFSFTKVEPGRYGLSAEKAGYVRQQYGRRAGQFGPGTNLTLEAGQKITNLEFRLMPQAVITGKVVDEDGEPVPHAMIGVLRQIPLLKQPMVMMGAPANDVGEFRIANLAPGRYLVRAEHRQAMFGPARPASAGGASTSEGTTGYVPTYYPGVTDEASAAAVIVAAGQQLSGIDIQIQKGRVFQVSGKIQGAPAGGRLQVSLQPQKVTGGMVYGFGGGGNVKADGSFFVSSVQPGSWEVVAMSLESGRPQILGRTPVNVTNANVENLVIQAGTPLEVTGRVLREGETQSSLTGQVMLQPVQRGGPVFTPPARIQDDGTFKISGVSRDKVFVQVIGLPPELYVKTVRADHADIIDSGLDLSKAESAPALEIRVSAKGATVDGVVYDGDKPSPGALVVLLAQPYLPDRPGTMQKTASTDQNGRFSIQGIAPGEYRVYAWDSFLPWNQVDAEQLRAFEKFSATVKLKEEAREHVDLKAAPVAPE